MADFDVDRRRRRPAGVAAALVPGPRRPVASCLLERGPFPGSKNMYGGVVYGRILDGLIPSWWEEAPIQRWVTRRATMMMTPTQALTVDFRTEAWGEPPYNGATAFRPDFDAWLAGHAERGRRRRSSARPPPPGCCATGGRVVGVRTDRPDGDLTAEVVIACDGVNSFLAKEAGLYPHTEPEHFTLGVKEMLALPREEIDERFGLRGHEGADFEIVGCTGGVPGGGFLYTNLDTRRRRASCCSCPGLAAQAKPARGAHRRAQGAPRRSPRSSRAASSRSTRAHLIPEGGFDMMPELIGDGMLVAGDAAAMCLAAGHLARGRQLRHRLGHRRRRRRRSRRCVAATRPPRPRRLPRAASRPTSCWPTTASCATCPTWSCATACSSSYPQVVVQRGRAAVHRRQPRAQAGARRRSSGPSCKRAGVKLARPGPATPGPAGEELRMTATDARPAAAYPDVSFEDRMGTVEFRVARAGPHHRRRRLVPRAARPRRASPPARPTCSCPRRDGGILFNYEQCFECGTCYMVCNTEGAITWTYPDGGHGVVFRRSLSVARLRDRRLREVGRPAPRDRPAHRARSTPTRAVAGFSDADRAALESALRLAERCAATVTSRRCAGPADGRRRPARRAGRRAAPARWCGSTLDRRRAPIDVRRRRSLAASLAGAVDLVVCGDHSLDRGSGLGAGASSPTQLGARAGARPGRGRRRRSPPTGTLLGAVRRLDGGRRERLRVAARRCSRSRARWRGCVAPRCVDVVAARAMPDRGRRVRRPAPTRDVPRSDRGAAAPAAPGAGRRPTGDRALDRIVALTGALVERTPPRRVEAAHPAEAAEAILDQLRTWGYLE